MGSLPRCETDYSLRRACMVVAPTNILWLRNVIPNIGLLEVSCNINQILVTGFDLPQLSLHYKDHPYARFHKESSKKSLLQLPDHSYNTTIARFKSYKYWDGVIPPKELVEAGFYMIARNQVKCFSCSIVAHVLDWKKGDDAVDIHYLRSPNCSFIKELLNRVYIDKASRDGAEINIPNHHPYYSEKPLIKDRVKKAGSSVDSSSVTNKTEPSSVVPNNVCKSVPVINHLISGMNYLPSQGSVSAHINLPRSSTKSMDAIISPPPSEKIVLVSRLDELSPQSTCCNIVG